MKICFLAPSGYGKSTAIDILKRNYDVINIKIGDPLYELQEDFYNKIGIDCTNKQDGELLQFLGIKIRKESPNYLLDTFNSKLNKYDDKELIITNDDCRTYDYDFLKKSGFKFIKINGYKRERDDISEANPNLNIEWKSEIPFDYEVDNKTTLKDYENKLITLMKEILNDR